MNYNLLINNTQPSLAISYTGGDYRVEIRANVGWGEKMGEGGLLRNVFLDLKRLPKLVFFCTQKPEIHAKSYKRPLGLITTAIQ